MSPRATGRSRAGYIPALDGIRGLLLPGVVFTHYALIFLLLNQPPDWLTQATPYTMNIEMFFALSGALITSLLVREFRDTGDVSLKQFYVRRTRRLWPALIVSVLVLLIIRPWMPSIPGTPVLGTSTILTVFVVFASLGNWRAYAIYTNAGLGWLGPTWTLGIEEQFYLSWPLLLRTALRRRVPRVGILLFLALLTIVCVAISSLIFAKLDWGKTFYATPTQLPAVLIGCMLGYELSTNPGGWLMRSLRPLWVGLLGAVAVVAVTYFFSSQRHWIADGGYAVYGVAASVLIGHCFATAEHGTLLTRVLAWKPFVVMGQVSYEAYVVHVAIIYATVGLLPGLRPVPMAILDAALLALIAGSIYLFIERPIRRRGWRATFAGATRRVLARA